MINKFLALIHTALSLILGFGVWYLIIWFFTNQSNPFFWSQFCKIMYVLCGGFASESYRAQELVIRIKKRKDE
mgnify:CR=1 FL=1